MEFRRVLFRSMNCWYLTELGITTVGLCHSVQGTSRMLAEQVGVDYDNVSFRCAGINHQSWFLEFKENDRDLLPTIKEAMSAKYEETETRARRSEERGGGKEWVRK